MCKLLLLSLFAAAVVGQMTQAFRDNILRDHNDKRRQATNGANMIELRYDMALEQVAQAYLNKGCSGGFRHNPNRACDYKNRGGTNAGTSSSGCPSVGENWYSGAPDNKTGTDVVIGGAVAQWTDGTCSSWASPPLRCGSHWCSEKQNFYQTGSDSYGSCNQNSGQTLHYTQAMWATTTHVGCGYTTACGTLCNYAPGGNMNLPSMGSMREANLWKIGSPCSQCPSAYSRCNAGLCSAGAASVSSCPADNTNKPTNGNVGTCGTSTAVGSTCTQVCNTGYQLTSGSLSRSCQSSGTLSSVTAVCSAVTCSADSSTKPTNGNAGACGTSSKTYGQTCSMACNSGFVLSSGSLVRTCGSNSQFSASNAVCSAVTSAPTTTRPPVYTSAPATSAPATPTSAPTGYCNSGPTSNIDAEFGLVQLIGYGTQIYDTEGCPGGQGPSIKTNMRVTVAQGESYLIRYDRTTCGDYYNALAGAWIDWNQNGAWEASESLFAFRNTYRMNSITFTVPTNAKLGTTRLRVQVQETASTTTTLNPCAMFEWGDTKDYTVNVIASTPQITCPGTMEIKPVNGNSGTCLSTKSYGQSCTQRCNTGYELTFGSLDSVCGADGSYSASTAICSLASASSLNSVFVSAALAECAPDGTFPENGGPGTCGENSSFGESCTQTCNAGFNLRAGTSLERECTSSGYSASNAVCE